MNTTAPTVDLAAIKARQQETWSTGDFAVVAARIAFVAERLAEAADLRADWRVLDVATGSGNAAIAAARSGCEVVGVDYVPELLERGRQRAAVEGLEVTFLHGDAEELPFPDHSFDAVLSVYGSMFAPHQERAAAELLRVCRPGGTVAMANWTPDGFIGQVFKTIARHLPPPAGLKSPALWGTRERIEALFGAAAASIRAEPAHFVFRYRSPEHWLQVFRSWYGPLLKAYAALEPAAQAALTGDLLALVGRFNRAGDGTMVVPSEYLEIVVTRR